MKIRKVKWNNHPILGNLELDFTDPISNLPYDNIVFAGENGTGKSTILKTLNSFLCVGSFEPFAYIEYVTDDGEAFKATPSARQGNKTFFDRQSLQNQALDEIRRDNNNNREQMLADNHDPRSYGSFLSQARSDFRTSEINAATSLELDKEIHNRDSKDDYTSLKQLLVDIEALDDSLYKEINRQASGSGQQAVPYNVFERNNSKIFRFKNAFNSFFEKLQYDRVKTDGGRKEIVFTKNGNEILIDDLSTGEKQIVFRGAYLLKNLKKLNGATIFIDEPEMSMHPKWQGRIMDFYTGLFRNGQGQQKAQVFFCTHSGQFLSSALQTRNTLVIVLNEDNGIITPELVPSVSIPSPLTVAMPPRAVLPTITAAETNYLAFDVVSSDYHIALYGRLQEREGNLNVYLTDKYISRHRNYNAAIHEYRTSYNGTVYHTLPTMVRNAIDHPQTSVTYTQAQLRTSIELLRAILATP